MMTVLGAYPASPPPGSAEFTEFHRLLTGLDRVRGLELPTHQLADPHARATLAEVCPQHWQHVVTGFPATMLAMLDDPDTGLASPAEPGRRRAVAAWREVAEQIADFVAAGGGTVSHVQLHSAPRGGSTAALGRSLGELAGLDWSGARLVIEHCDAPAADHPAEKGFLQLAEELAVLDEHPGIGVLINWGRSALEGRSAETVVEHLRTAREAGRLAGLFLSGVAAVDNPYGAAWTDGHLPMTAMEPASLMDAEQVTRCLTELPPDAVLGLKIRVSGDTDAVAVAERAQRFGRAVDQLAELANARTVRPE